MKDINVLSFSGGRTSAFMLAKYKDQMDYVIFCNTGKEANGTLDFVRKCGKYFDKEIIWLEYTTENPKLFKIVDYNTASRNGEPFEMLIKKNNFLPGENARFCTRQMKVYTIKRYLKSLKIDLEYVNMNLGIRKDEPRRYFKLKDNMKDKWQRVMPLYKDNITENDVLEFWKNQPFDLEIHSHMGNCDLCFNKKLSKKLHLIKENPHVANWWIEMEKLIGSKFNKNYTIEKLVKMSNDQIDIFDYDNDIECYCNID